MSACVLAQHRHLASNFLTNLLTTTVACGAHLALDTFRSGRVFGGSGGGVKELEIRLNSAWLQLGIRYGLAEL